MFNLLPQSDQRNLVFDYRLRFAVVGLLLLSALEVIALLALTPSFLLSYHNGVLAQKNINLLKAEIVQRSKDHLSDTLTFTAKEISALGVTNSTAYSYELVADIIHSKTEAIKITSVHITTVEDGKRGITLTGQAPDRDSLVSFVKVLKQEGAFHEVTVPVSNFAAASDINFSILIKTK